MTARIGDASRKHTPFCTFGCIAILPFLVSVPGCSGQNGLEVIGGSQRTLEITDRHSPHSARFLLRNTGASPVTITAIQTGCTCTSGYLEGDSVLQGVPRNVAPGDELTIVVEIKSFSPYDLDFSEYAIVRTSRQRLLLEVRGKLPPPTDILYRPHVVVIDPTVEQQRVNLSLRIPKASGATVGGDSFELLDLSSFAPRVTVGKSNSSLGFNDYEVVIELIRADTAAFSGGSIKVVPSEGPSITIPVVPKIQLHTGA